LPSKVLNLIALITFEDDQGNQEIVVSIFTGLDHLGSTSPTTAIPRLA